GGRRMIKRRTGRWCERWPTTAGSRSRARRSRRRRRGRRLRRGDGDGPRSPGVSDCRGMGSVPSSSPLNTALAVRGLVKEYVRGKRVLDGIDLEFAPSGITAVIGPSGTGKSTLLRCINRLVEPTAGGIVFCGRDIA